MAKNYGTGVSRVLDPNKSQYTTVVWQQNKPPTDAELSLMSDIAEEQRKLIVSKSMPSGWLGNGLNDSEAFVTNSTWSNWFKFGQQKTDELGAIQWANVNGWLIPVTGTLTGTPPGSPDDSSTWNRVTLSPPPSNSGDARIDFVFLEAWQALIPPNPSSTNKPSASGIYRYGNKEGGYSFLTDDLIDPSIGFETTQRVQIQYRIRVVTGLVGLTSFPDGFDPASVQAQGAASAVTSFTFTNMRKTLGDPGLWRAGDGTPNSLGTVDGYTYAIPLAAIFRRNTVAWDGDPGQNLNGGFNRNPTAIDRTGWTTFSTTPTLSADMSAAQLTLSLVSAANIPLPTTPATAVYIQVGDEIMQYTFITGTTVTLSARGALGTKAEVHKAGDTVSVVAGRPDGLFSDQIAKTDILDLRHVVAPGGFDYSSLLDNSLDALLRGKLRSTWKRTGAGSVQGPYVLYQNKISSSAAAVGIVKLEAPDGVRQVWSDASYMQPVEFIAAPPASRPAAPPQDISTTWDLSLSGTVDTSASPAGTYIFSPGDVITIPISQFQTAVGSDTDQVQFPNLAGAVSMRLADSETELVEGGGNDFTVTLPTGPSDDLVITLDANFNGGNPSIQNVALYITFHVQYGKGRGLSHKPDSVHSVAFLSAASGTMTRQKNIPANNIPMSTAWAPLWSKFRSDLLQGNLPVTAESYIDPGSKTVVLTPFRRIDLPTDINGDGVFRAHRNTALHGGAGPCPDAGLGGTSDPLNLFSTGLQGTNAGSTFTIIPRHLVPGWGEFRIPIIHTDTTDFDEGINFFFNTPKSLLATNQLTTFVPRLGDRPAVFSTWNIDSSVSATYNAAFNILAFSITAAGAQLYTDSRGLGRTGIQLPPFYLPTRIYAIYDSEDYSTNLGSSYDPSDREFDTLRATNLLRQDFDGPVFWIERTVNGDPYVVINSEVVDFAKSPSGIASFSSSQGYVVECEIICVDRGAFDVDQPCRVVLNRSRTVATDLVGAPTDNAIPVDDINMAIPAPPSGAESIAVNFSRTPYQGDIYSSQLSGVDSPQRLGPLTSSTAFQISNTELDQDNLSRPNPKVVEVLASRAFVTSLGTGRIGGDYDPTDTLDYRNPGAESAANYPPATAVDARPSYIVSNILGTDESLYTLGTEYAGATDRLPLGSLIRDSDFRGDSVIGDTISPLVYLAESGPALEATVMSNVRKDGMTEADVFQATPSSGGSGEVVAVLDGESGNFALDTNYRTNRGGSAFVVSGPRPGGSVGRLFGKLTTGTNYNTYLSGVAMLVRNTVTNVGASERSAGQELQMLIVTTATRRHGTNDVPVRVLCGTSGSGEGYAAADLYRVMGRPITNDAARVDNDSTTVTLTPPTSLKPRIGG